MRGMKLEFTTCIEYMEYMEGRKKRAKKIIKKLDKMKKIKIKLKDEERWKEWNNENADSPYGKAIVSTATKWAKAMELLMEKGFELEEIAGEAIDICDPDSGLTGYAESCLVNLLSQCWKHGDNLRLWYNKNHGGYNGDGVANPAKMLIG